MNKLVQLSVALSSMIPFAALANPFQARLGDYKVVSCENSHFPEICDVQNVQIKEFKLPQGRATLLVAKGGDEGLSVEIKRLLTVEAYPGVTCVEDLDFAKCAGNGKMQTVTVKDTADGQIILDLFFGASPEVSAKLTLRKM